MADKNKQTTKQKKRAREEAAPTQQSATMKKTQHQVQKQKKNVKVVESASLSVTSSYNRTRGTTAKKEISSCNVHCISHLFRSLACSPPPNGTLHERGGPSAAELFVQFEHQMMKMTGDSILNQKTQGEGPATAVTQPQDLQEEPEKKNANERLSFLLNQCRRGFEHYCNCRFLELYSPSICCSSFLSSDMSAQAHCSSSSIEGLVQYCAHIGFEFNFGIHKARLAEEEKEGGGGGATGTVGVLWKEGITFSSIYGGDTLLQFLKLWAVSYQSQTQCEKPWQLPKRGRRTLKEWQEKIFSTFIKTFLRFLRRDGHVGSHTGLTTSQLSHCSKTAPSFIRSLLVMFPGGEEINCQAAADSRTGDLVVQQRSLLNRALTISLPKPGPTAPPKPYKSPIAIDNEIVTLTEFHAYLTGSKREIATPPSTRQQRSLLSTSQRPVARTTIHRPTQRKQNANARPNRKNQQQLVKSSASRATKQQQVHRKRRRFDESSSSESSSEEEETSSDEEDDDETKEDDDTDTDDDKPDDDMPIGRVFVKRNRSGCGGRSRRSRTADIFVESSSSEDEDYLSDVEQRPASGKRGRVRRSSVKEESQNSLIQDLIPKKKSQRRKK